MSDAHEAPLIVGIGGTTRSGSSTEAALVVALDAARRSGARTRLIDGAALTALPHYLAGDGAGAGAKLIASVREAQGVIIASPGYHGSISGLVKNAVDYLEETAKDARPYLDGLPVGLIVTAYGWQATGSTLAALRSVVHALRGWPTPLGVALNTSSGLFTDGVCTDARASDQLRLVGEQVAAFALRSHAARSAFQVNPGMVA